MFSDLSSHLKALIYIGVRILLEKRENTAVVLAVFPIFLLNKGRKLKLWKEFSRTIGGRLQMSQILTYVLVLSLKQKEF